MRCWHVWASTPSITAINRRRRFLQSTGGRGTGRWLAACVRVTGVALLSACTHHSPEISRPASTHHDIVVLGDSLALGTGASDAAHGFAFVLFQRMATADPTAQITDFAAGGARASDVLSSQMPQARAYPATDVWICVGGNDVTHGTAQQEFAAQERALLAAAQTQWPRARVVVFGIPDVSRSPLFAGISRLYLHRLARADNDAASSAARQSGAKFVDLFKFSERILDADRDLSADSFHPNDRGYQEIADFAQPTVGE